MAGEPMEKQHGGHRWSTEVDDIIPDKYRGQYLIITFLQGKHPFGGPVASFGFSMQAKTIYWGKGVSLAEKKAEQSNKNKINNSWEIVSASISLAPSKILV